MTKKFIDKYDQKAMRQAEIRAEEFDDIDLVLEMGAKKYGNLNWTKPDGTKSGFYDMHMSMTRHLAESFMGVRQDDESGLDPLLHLATRALMMYTLLQRGIRVNQYHHMITDMVSQAVMIADKEGG